MEEKFVICFDHPLGRCYVTKISFSGSESEYSWTCRDFDAAIKVDSWEVAQLIADIAAELHPEMICYPVCITE